MRREYRGARFYRFGTSCVAHNTYLRAYLCPYKPWGALLLLLGDIELNPGPSSGHWAAVHSAVNKGLVKSAAVCTQPSAMAWWALFNVGGATVHWNWRVTIVQLLSDMRLDIVGLQEVKPTFPNIEAATTLTFPEWQIYYHPHPSGTIQQVAFPVRNTVDRFVRWQSTCLAFCRPRWDLYGTYFAASQQATTMYPQLLWNPKCSHQEEARCPR